eukprot:Skav224427  [mRNA]  locus=scaffold657:532577:532858:- [translate_table: standard]
MQDIDMIVPNLLAGDWVRSNEWLCISDGQSIGLRIPSTSEILLSTFLPGILFILEHLLPTLLNQRIQQGGRLAIVHVPQVSQMGSPKACCHRI